MKIAQKVDSTMLAQMLIVAAALRMNSTDSASTIAFGTFHQTASHLVFSINVL